MEIKPGVPIEINIFLKSPDINEAHKLAVRKALNKIGVERSESYILKVKFSNCELAYTMMGWECRYFFVAIIEREPNE
jgi:hypothetical protein